MGKVFRLSWELNLLLSCFGLSALGIYCNRWPSLPAWHLLTMVLQGTEWQGSVRLNLIEDASAPSLFPSSCISYLWCGPSTAQMKRNIYNHYHNACTQRKKCGVISMEIIKYRKADGTGILLMLLKFKALATVITKHGHHYLCVCTRVFLFCVVYWRITWVWTIYCNNKKMNFCSLR